MLALVPKSLHDGAAGLGLPGVRSLLRMREPERGSRSQACLCSGELGAAAVGDGRGDSEQAQGSLRQPIPKDRAGGLLQAGRWAWLPQAGTWGEGGTRGHHCPQQAASTRGTCGFQEKSGHLGARCERQRVGRAACSPGEPPQGRGRPPAGQPCGTAALRRWPPAPAARRDCPERPARAHTLSLFTRACKRMHTEQWTRSPGGPSASASGRRPLSPPAGGWCGRCPPRPSARWSPPDHRAQRQAVSRVGSGPWMSFAGSLTWFKKGRGGQPCTSPGLLPSSPPDRTGQWRGLVPRLAGPCRSGTWASEPDSASGQRGRGWG